MSATGPGPAAARSRSRARLDTIHRTLRERICLLRYPPGHVLSESVLAEAFGVSRTPIRRVLGRLENEGLVERRHGIGTIVTTVDVAALADICALRARLAEAMGELAPLPRSSDDIAALRSLHARVEALARHRDETAFAQISMEYMLMLLDGVGNRALRDTMERLYFQTSRIWLQAMGGMNWAEEVAIFATEIAEVMRAMELGDPRAVGLTHRNHISMSMLRLSRHIGPVGGPPRADGP